MLSLLRSCYEPDLPGHLGFEILYFSCIKAGKRGGSCHGRMTEYPDGRKVFSLQHNHPPHLNCQKGEVFKLSLRDAVQKETASLKSIYDRLKLTHQEAALNTPYKAIKRSMLRWRRETQKRGLGTVRFISDYVKFFESPAGESLMHYDVDGDRKMSYKVIEEGGRKHLMLYDEAFLKEMEHCQVFHGDSTFLSRPLVRDTDQLLTIMGRMYDKAFPCVWVLMNGKKTESYEKIFNVLKNEVWPEMKPVEFLADFEEAFEKAAQNVFRAPDGSPVNVIGCFFHFAQALMKNARSKGAATSCNLRDHPDKHFVIRKVMALAVLPEGEIRKAFDEIKEDAQEKFGDEFDDFFSYFEDYWLNRRGPSRFCVYRKVHRTNNEEESYHKILNVIFHNKRPNPWNFIRELFEIQKSTHVDLQIEANTLGSTKTMKSRTIFDNDNLNKCWDALDEKRLTNMMVLTKVANAVMGKYLQIKEIADKSLITVDENFDGSAQNDDTDNDNSDSKSDEGESNSSQVQVHLERSQSDWDVVFAQPVADEIRSSFFPMSEDSTSSVSLSLNKEDSNAEILAAFDFEDNCDDHNNLKSDGEVWRFEYEERMEENSSKITQSSLPACQGTPRTTRKRKATAKMAEYSRELEKKSSRQKKTKISKNQ